MQMSSNVRTGHEPILRSGGVAKFEKYRHKIVAEWHISKTERCD